MFTAITTGSLSPVFTQGDACNPSFHADGACVSNRADAAGARGRDAMPRADRVTGHADPIAGLCALARLVLAALEGATAIPAPAGHLSSSPIGPLMMKAIGASSTPRWTRAGARPKPITVATQTDRIDAANPTAAKPTTANPTAATGNAATIDSATIDSAHAETWELVRLAQTGDGDAFGALYDRYVDTVFRFIYYRVNDRAIAEDYTSETFLRALKRIATISYQGSDIGAWFVTIARNIVLDHVKSARNRLEITTADPIEATTHVVSTENAVLAKLSVEALMAAVAQLGDEQRECVTLRFIQGLSVSETAAAMGKNDGAVKALQHRAVRKLADLLGEQSR